MIIRTPKRGDPELPGPTIINEHHIFPTSDRILARALPERRESIILVEQQV
jgi:hypothetical protein